MKRLTYSGRSAVGPFRRPSGMSPSVAARVIQGVWRNRQFLKRLGRSSLNTVGSMASRWVNSRGSRSVGKPGGKGSAWRTPASGNSRPARRSLNKIRGFRGFPEVNETYLDLHSSASFILRADIGSDGVPTSSAYHHFFVPIDASDIEPFLTEALTIGPDSSAFVSRPVDDNARGYPCNQLLEYYNNYVVKGTTARCDLRAVVRNPGGAAEAASTWYQAGQVTLPVNCALLRLTKEEMDYILNDLPTLLGGVSTEYGEEGLQRFDRVMREQFGAVPFTLTGDRMTGTVSTSYNCAVQNTTDAKTVTEGISSSVDLAATDQPFNKYMGVTGQGAEFGVIKKRPEMKTYFMLIGWFNPAVLGEYFTGRPNTREVEVGMDFHIRQQLAFGDVRSQASGISVGGNIVSRAISALSTLDPLVVNPRLPRGSGVLVPTEAPKLKRSKKMSDAEAL